jgi:lysyl-tRNA synthetase class 2
MSTWKELKDNPRLKEMYVKRLEIIKLIREFFWQQGFVEADVPLALKLPGQEPYLHPVPVIFHSPENQGEQFYLHTSPELSLKKLLAVGFSKLFAISKCFRDYESFGDGTHNTEFTMNQKKIILELKKILCRASVCYTEPFFIKN